MKLSTRYGVAVSILAVVAGTLLYSIWQWRDASNRGWSGMNAQINATTKGGTPSAMIMADMVEPRSPASRAGIVKGDRISAINGESDGLVDRYMAVRPGETVRLTIDGSPPREVTIRFEDPFFRASTLVGVFSNLLMSAIAIGIGAYVFLKQPGDPRTLILLIFTAAYAIAGFIHVGPEHRAGLMTGGQIIPLMLMVGSSLLLSPALLHFFLVFPKRRPVLDRYPRVLAFIYGVPSVGAALITLLMLAATLSVKKGQGPIEAVEAAFDPVKKVIIGHEVAVDAVIAVLAGFGLLIAAFRLYRDRQHLGWKSALYVSPGRTIAILICAPALVAALLRESDFAVGLRALSTAAGVVALAGAGIQVVIAVLSLTLIFPLASCIAAYRSYRESHGEEKRQLRWPIWGALVGVPAYVLIGPLLQLITWALHVPRQSVAAAVLHVAGRHLPALALLLVPLSVAAAVLKYRLMDIDSYVRRTVIYGAISAILGLLYLVVVGGVGRVVAGLMSIESEWVTVGSTLLIAALFVTVRKKVQGFVDVRFYRKKDYAAALRRLAVRLAEKGSRAALFQAVVEAAQEALHARGIVLWLLQPRREMFVVEGKVGPADDVLDLVIPSGGPLSVALDKPGPVPWSVLEHNESDALIAVGAAYLAPVRSGPTLAGFLAIGSKLSDADFDTEDVFFLEAVAAQVAAVLEQVRTRDEEQDFDRARDIQLALLPKSIPQPPGIGIYGSWQPARFIGGDYYDVMDLGGGRYGLAIADVSGKGLSAALLMSNLQAAVRVLALEAAPPATVCDRVNRIICRNVTSGRFITFFYGILDSTGRSFIIPPVNMAWPVGWRPTSSVTASPRLRTTGKKSSARSAFSGSWANPGTCPPATLGGGCWMRSADFAWAGSAMMSRLSYSRWTCPHRDLPRPRQ